MRFSCKKCNAKYGIADEKIRGKVIKVRCKHCGHVMVVRDVHRASVPAAPQVQSNLSKAPRPTVSHAESPLLEALESVPPVSEAPPPVSKAPLPEVSSEIVQPKQDDGSDKPVDISREEDFEEAFRGLYESGQEQEREPAPVGKPAGDQSKTGGQVWYFGLDGSEAGPFTAQEIQERIRVGEISRDHFVWREGMNDWAPVEKAFGAAVLLRQRRPPPTAVVEKKTPVVLVGDLKQKATTEAVDEVKRRVRERQESRERAEQARVQDIETAAGQTPSPESFDAEKALIALPPLPTVPSGGEELPTLSDTLELVPSSRADWFDESRFLPPADEQRIPAEEPGHERIEEALRYDLKTKPTEQVAPEAMPFDDLVADNIVTIRGELTLQPPPLKKPKPPEDRKQPATEIEKPVPEVLQRPKSPGDEHEIHQTSERFFELGESLGPLSELLPSEPPPDAQQAAVELRAESLLEENADSIPPIAAAPHPASDSVIIRYAGVHSTRRRFSMALIAVFFVIVAAGGTLALVLSQDWLRGSQLVSIRQDNGTAAIGDLQHTGKTEVSPEDAKRIRTFLEGDEPRPTPDAKPGPGLPKPLPTGMRGIVMPENNRDLFDVGIGGESQHAKPRVQKNEIGMITAPDVTSIADMKMNELHGKRTETAPLPPERLSGPEKLTDLQVHMVIQKYYAQVKSCQQRQLQRDSSIAGKMIVVARVRPNGTVDSVRVDTPSFRGSFVEECLIRDIKNWLFPAFKGETYDVPFQLQLMARE